MGGPSTEAGHGVGLPFGDATRASLHIAPIVRPSDLKASVSGYVAEAIRSGTGRLVGFESQGDALRLLEARERTRRPYVPTDTARAEPTRRWACLADVVDPHAYRGP